MTSDDLEAGVHRTGRWRGVGAAALLSGGLGLVTRRPALLLASAIGVALLAYAHVVPAPPLALTVTRRTRQRDAESGSEIDVRLTVRNVGERTIPDLRVVDGVPRRLEVVDGTPALGTTLRPGETTTVSYALEARRGTHQFDPAVAVARDVTGVVERRDRIAADDGEPVTTSESRALQTTPPLRTRTTRHAGRRPSKERGDGLAFDAVREYRRGDPPGRINWRTLARGGDLTTVEYRTDGAGAVLVAVDARPAAVRAPDPASPTAVERSLGAATELVERLADDGHRVGVATLGAGRVWIPPASGPEHMHRVREELQEQHGLTVQERHELTAERSDAGTVERSDAGTVERSDAGSADWLRDRIGSQTELLLLTPATDDATVELATRLEASGTAVSVLSPDVTDDASPGRRLARLERQRRLGTLRTAGVPTVDWARDEPLERASVRLGDGP